MLILSLSLLVPKRELEFQELVGMEFPIFLEAEDGIEIGAKHDVAPIGTFEEYLDQFWEEGKTHASGASYVVPVLEHLGVVEVDHTIPSKISLR